MLPGFRQDPIPPDRAGSTGAQGRRVGGQERSFLRVVGHELRSPLNSILGFSEILASELYGPLGSPQYVEYAGIIRSSGEKLLKLVNQVVEIARLQAGEVCVDLRPEPLAPILDDVVAALAQDLAARDLHLARLPGDLRVASDPHLLRDVLANLLDNAVAFSPDGGRIDVFARDAGEELDLTIENPCDGFDPHELGRLLRPFERGETGLRGGVEGAGLGLAICDLSCRAMGARLELRSERGRSFSAHIFLPKA
jgi:signal transduction histidine kinase